jgi:hypothetical protein
MTEVEEDRFICLACQARHFPAIYCSRRALLIHMTKSKNPKCVQEWSKICFVYTIHKLTNMFCQGQDSAPWPGLDIMLLKQQYLSVSGQAAYLARQRPPVEYVYRRSYPMLQFLPQKLAEWIANKYAAELNVPPRSDQSRHWSTATLNRILQTCIVSDSRCINIHTSSK